MIGLFVNPIAGKGKSLLVLREVERLLKREKISFFSFISNWPESLQGCEEGWIIGGDGTINFFINKYQNPSIPLAPLGGGTGDDFSWSLYGKISVESKVMKVLQSPCRLVDAGICNQRIFLNLIGIGFDGAVLESLGEKSRSWGHLTYLTEVIRKIFTYREINFIIRTGAQEFTGRRLLVSISNAPRTGGGFMIAPEARTDDGMLNLMLCDPLSRILRLRYLPVIEKGKHLKLPLHLPSTGRSGSH